MTTTTTETTINVKTLAEVKQQIDEAFTKPGLKALSIFVWSDESVGVEFKTSYQVKNEDS
jgi:hypothetical protein